MPRAFICLNAALSGPRKACCTLLSRDLPAAAAPAPSPPTAEAALPHPGAQHAALVLAALWLALRCCCWSSPLVVVSAAAWAGAGRAAPCFTFRPLAEAAARSCCCAGCSGAGGWMLGCASSSESDDWLVVSSDAQEGANSSGSHITPCAWHSFSSLHGHNRGEAWASRGPTGLLLAGGQRGCCQQGANGAAVSRGAWGVGGRGGTSPGNDDDPG